jgi:hypothetical protein
MIHLNYKGIEVTAGMYTLEYINANGINVLEAEFDIYAYQRLLIKAFDLQIDGYIVYCLTRTRQKIVKGMPVKRGVKRKNERTDSIGRGFRSEFIEPPLRMESIE